jgi:hypothetical protein
MFIATSNKAKQLVYLAFIQHVSVEDLKRARPDLEKMLPDLSAGVRVLADLERLTSMDTDCAAELGAVMELLDEKGVSMIVRVIPDPTKDIGLSIISVFHYHHKPRTATCRSMEEAAELLSL